MTVPLNPDPGSTAPKAGLGVMSLVAGLAIYALLLLPSFVFGFEVFPLPVHAAVIAALLAFVCGVSALVRARLKPAVYGGRGAAIGGVVASLTFWTILFMPPRKHPGISNRYSAIMDCRTVSSAEVAYASANGGAFGTLACLATPTACGFATGTTPFLDPLIASTANGGVVHGYVRRFVAGAAGHGKPDPGIETYVYTATPQTWPETGNGGFAIDHTGLICVTTTGAAPPLNGAALDPTCTPLQ